MRIHLYHRLNYTEHGMVSERTLDSQRPVPEPTMPDLGSPPQERAAARGVKTRLGERDHP